jgi:proton-coupled amino acid transporter
MSIPEDGSGDGPLLLGAERSTAPASARSDALDPFDDSDDDGARVARPDGFHGVTPSWNSILNSMMYMAAPLSMPATTAAGGWFWSFVFWAYCSCATYWTGLVVGRAYNANPSCDLSTYPRMAGEAFARLSLRRDPSDALAARAWRRRGVTLLVVTQFVTFYLDTVTQIIFLAEYLAQIFPSSRACPWVWLLVVWIATVPVMQIPTFHASRWVVVPAFAVLVASVCLFFAEIFVVAPWGCDPGPTFPPPTPSSAFVSLANFAYAYGGHGMFPESLREMRRPEDWPRVMRWCYGVMVPLYLACGAVGYRAYGGFAKANVNLNFPDNALNVASLVLQLLQTYYLVFYTNVVMTIAVERNVLGIEPGAGDADADEAPVRRPGSSPGEKSHSSATKTRFAFRTAWLASQCLLASAFMSSGSGDVIVDAQALTGAVGMALMTFFFPSVLAVALLPEGAVSSRERRWAAVNFAVGVVVAAAGVAASAGDLLRDGGGGGGFGGGCERDRFTYAPHDRAFRFFARGGGRGSERGWLEL